MDRVGDDVLPRAGLAEQDDGEVAFADPADHAIELAQPVVDDDDRRSAIVGARAPRLGNGGRVALDGGADDEDRRADGDDLTALDGDAGAAPDPDAGDACPVRAAQVLDGDRAAPEEDGVLPGYRGVVDA